MNTGSLRPKARYVGGERKSATTPDKPRPYHYPQVYLSPLPQATQGERARVRGQIQRNVVLGENRQIGYNRAMILYNILS